MVDSTCCYKCEKRHPKCHGECDEYLSFRKAKDAQNAKIRAEREREERITTYIISNIDRKKKRKRGNR